MPAMFKPMMLQFLVFCHSYTPFTLCYLIVQFPLELDPWELLQKHVLSDYVNNEVQVYKIIEFLFCTVFFLGPLGATGINSLL